MGLAVKPVRGKMLCCLYKNESHRIILLHWVGVMIWKVAVVCVFIDVKGASDNLFL